MRVVALSEIQGQHFEEPTVVIAQTVGGMEDIPVRVPVQINVVPAQRSLGEEC